MPARYYTQTFEEKGATIRIVWIDTTPLIEKYRQESDKYPDACKQDVNKQLSWLESVLANAKEDWVIVAGHHPIYAYTPKEESERLDMQKRVDTILRKHKVDMYICGHTLTSSYGFREVTSIMSLTPPAHWHAKWNLSKVQSSAAPNRVSLSALSTKKSSTFV